jgi:hypothetical protein
MQRGKISFNIKMGLKEIERMLRTVNELKLSPSFPRVRDELYI